MVFIAAAWPLWRVASLADESRPVSKGHLAPGTFALLADPRVRWVLVVAAIEGALMFSVLAFTPNFLAARHGLGTTAAGGAIALFGVGGLLYSRLAKRLLGRFGERGLAAGGGALVGASLLALAWSGHWMATLPACLLAGSGFYMLHATLQTQATQMSPARRGTAVAWFACLLFLGQSVGVLAMSVAVDHGLAAQAISACGTGLAILGAVVARGVTARVLVTPGA
jgi:predicted MFS family arabinose efflux permease